MPTQVEEKVYTLEEYFELEYASETRHQFINGKILPVSPYTSKSHGRIVNNFARILSACLLESSFEVFAGDRMLYIPACQKTYYPDLMILPLEVETLTYKGKMEADLYPRVIIEILSDSTEEEDRTEKWRCYKMIEPLQQYILVSQKRSYVEAYYRQEDRSKWLYTSAEGPDARIEIQGCSVALEEIYRRVAFAKAA